MNETIAELEKDSSGQMQDYEDMYHSLTEEEDSYIYAMIAEEENAYMFKKERDEERIFKAIQALKGDVFIEDIKNICFDLETPDFSLCDKPAGTLEEIHSDGGELNYIFYAHVEQWTGYVCDDYQGNIYIKLRENKYLKIRYSC